MQNTLGIKKALPSIIPGSTTQDENINNLYWCSLTALSAAIVLNYHLTLNATWHTSP